MRQAIAIIILVVSFSLSAQEKPKDTKDPFDVSATAKQAKELGIPTVSEVAALEAKANELYDAEKVVARPKEPLRAH